MQQEFTYDFPLILVLASAVTGLVWLFDALFLKKKRQRRIEELVQQGADREKVEQQYQPSWVIEYSRSFFPVILAVLLLRSFVAEPFRIPSGSMMPTLLIGDFILVEKYAYGLRLPVTHDKIIDIDEPKRGDVVVFRYPRNPGTDYIKRVIGLPGDRIVYMDKTIYVNGEPMKQEPLGVYVASGASSAMTGASHRREYLGNVVHDILVRATPTMPAREYIVPEGEYFVMGDNRDNSNDSRFWGTVPEENLVGKAVMIWMSWDWSNGGIQWNRIGKSID